MKILDITSRSVTIELNDNNPYYSYETYKIYLNNALIRSDNKNVFTIYDLIPNSEYELGINNRIVKFKTKDESVCLDVKAFNAKGNGVNDDTIMIQTAIMCCPPNGVVYLPEGVYLVSSLFIKSDMMFYLDRNAKIIAKTQRDEFPIFPGLIGDYNYGVWEGSEVNNFASIVNGINISNAIICGGEIDCRALDGDWYINHRVMNIAWRGHAAFFNRCNNVKIIGTYIHNTQSWAIHPYFSDNISFYNLRIENCRDMPTTDGIDPDCCNNVIIKGCDFSVGDDCIAIKSGTIELAKKYRRPSSNITISNNLMKDGHGGVVFGSESSAGIYNVTVDKCLFLDTDRGLRIKTRRGRGNIGSINNVLFNNIIMDGVKTPFVINMYYNMGPKGGHDEYVWTTKKLPVDENTPSLGKFCFSNMKCYNIEYAAAVLLGLPEMPIESVKFRNILFSYKEDAREGYPVMIEHNFTMCKKGIYAFNVLDVIMDNVDFIGLGNEEKIIRKESN
ncbi:MAG: glycoside hydrolase family 28 protein [Anaeroplasma sp.]